MKARQKHLLCMTNIVGCPVKAVCISLENGISEELIDHIALLFYYFILLLFIYYYYFYYFYFYLCTCTDPNGRNENAQT